MQNLRTLILILGLGFPTAIIFADFRQDEAERFKRENAERVEGGNLPPGSYISGVTGCGWASPTAVILESAFTVVTLGGFTVLRTMLKEASIRVAAIAAKETARVAALTAAKVAADAAREAAKTAAKNATRSASNAAKIARTTRQEADEAARVYKQAVEAAKSGDEAALESAAIAKANADEAEELAQAAAAQDKQMSEKLIETHKANQAITADIREMQRVTRAAQSAVEQADKQVTSATSRLSEAEKALQTAKDVNAQASHAVDEAMTKTDSAALSSAQKSLLDSRAAINANTKEVERLTLELQQAEANAAQKNAELAVAKENEAIGSAPKSVEPAMTREEIIAADPGLTFIFSNLAKILQILLGAAVPATMIEKITAAAQRATAKELADDVDSFLNALRDMAAGFDEFYSLQRVLTCTINDPEEIIPPTETLLTSLTLSNHCTGDIILQDDPNDKKLNGKPKKKLKCTEWTVEHVATTQDAPRAQDMSCGSAYNVDDKAKVINAYGKQVDATIYSCNPTLSIINRTPFDATIKFYCENINHSIKAGESYRYSGPDCFTNWNKDGLATFTVEGTPVDVVFTLNRTFDVNAYMTLDTAWNNEEVLVRGIRTNDVLPGQSIHGLAEIPTNYGALKAGAVFPLANCRNLLKEPISGGLAWSAVCKDKNGIEQPKSYLYLGTCPDRMKIFNCDGKLNCGACAIDGCSGLQLETISGGAAWSAICKNAQGVDQEKSYVYHSQCSDNNLLINQNGKLACSKTTIANCSNVHVEHISGGDAWSAICKNVAGEEQPTSYVYLSQCAAGNSLVNCNGKLACGACIKNCGGVILKGISGGQAWAATCNDNSGKEQAESYIYVQNCPDSNKLNNCNGKLACGTCLTDCGDIQIENISGGKAWSAICKDSTGKEQPKSYVYLSGCADGSKLVNCNGKLMCGTCPNAAVYPPGPWRDKCSNWAIAGNILSAKCAGVEGAVTNLDVTTCAEGQVINSCDGKLICTTGTACSAPGAPQAPEVPAAAQPVGSVVFPQGPWRDKCSYWAMDGTKLSAKCAGVDGPVSTIDMTSCSVSQKINACNGTLQCTPTEACAVPPAQPEQPQSPSTQPSTPEREPLPESPPDRQPQPVQPQPEKPGEGNLHITMQGGFPVGNWRDYCAYWEMQNNVLSARCKINLSDAVYQSTSTLDLTTCTQGQVVGSCNAKLKCITGNECPQPVVFPPGPWRDNCAYWDMQGTLLSAQCKIKLTDAAYQPKSSLDVTSCAIGKVINACDGKLACTTGTVCPVPPSQPESQPEQPKLPSTQQPAPDHGPQPDVQPDHQPQPSAQPKPEEPKKEPAPTVKPKTKAELDAIARAKAADDAADAAVKKAKEVTLPLEQTQKDDAIKAESEARTKQGEAQTKYDDAKAIVTAIATKNTELVAAKKAKDKTRIDAAQQAYDEIKAANPDAIKNLKDATTNLAAAKRTLTTATAKVTKESADVTRLQDRIKLLEQTAAKTEAAKKKLGIEE